MKDDGKNSFCYGTIGVEGGGVVYWLSEGRGNCNWCGWGWLWYERGKKHTRYFQMTKTGDK